MAGIRQAKAICARCPLQDACLAYALQGQETYGIWGGHTERERRRLLRYRHDRIVGDLAYEVEAVNQ
jgi:WhiB family transcriptional regulator, redox-sensing transcriptional regulator